MSESPMPNDFKPANSRMLSDAMASGPSPLLGAQLSAADQLRARVLFQLMRHNTLGLEALEQVELLMGILEEGAVQVDNASAKLFAERIRHDFEDGVESMLRLRDAGIFDACRDLMEVSVLLRDFRREPQRYERWTRLDENERGRDFNFVKLLYKYPDEELTHVGKEPRVVERHYIIHSRTLHPANPRSHATELSRGQLHIQTDDDLAFWIGAAVVEITSHTLSAFVEFLGWTHELNPDITYDTELPEHNAIVAQMDQHYGFLDTYADPSEQEAWHERYAPPKRDAFGRRLPKSDDLATER